MDVDLLFLLVPGGMCIENTHTSILKLEVGHAQVGSCIEVFKEIGNFRLTRGFSTELDRMEIDEVEDIVHLYISEVGGKGVGGMS